MGKIIGIGGGFGDKDEVKLARDIMELTGKATPRYLQIPTTGYDFADGHSIAFYCKMGCDVDVLYLTHAYMTDEIIRQKIEAADMIHVPGGNLKFVADTWRRTGADRYLKQAFNDGKVLFGSSSGSMCWFRQGFDDCGPEDSFMFVDALGLLPYNNVPHYEGEFWQTFNRYADKTPLSSICCENDTAIQYIDGVWSVRVAERRPDARVWFFDASDGYKRYDLRQHPEILETL
ncbi:MAG: Type 1 glutamine amidotransferase-like domain-containing protein [Clostridia bacterium]|nr:Type 1 glutamine amidotransferase-like domain-containing protein [Clostridia bacterium]